MLKSRFTLIGLKHQIIINQLGIRIQNGMGCRQAILACNHPITDWGNQTCYPNMLSTNKLSHHAFGQSKAREARHAILACSSLDKLSHHAVSQSKAMKARYTIPACSESQSQHSKARHTIPTYTAQAHYPSIHCTN